MRYQKVEVMWMIGRRGECTTINKLSVLAIKELVVEAKRKGL